MKDSTLIILSPGFPADEADTTCLPAQQALVRSINRIFPSVRVIILAFQYPHSSLPYEWYRNRVIPFNGQNKGGLRRLYTWLRVGILLRKLHRKSAIRGIFSFWLGECALIGQRFGRLYHLQHVTWLLGQDAKKNNRYATRISLHAGSLAAISDSLADTFYKNYGIRPAYVIPNGIDPMLFGRMEHPRDIEICGAGSLIALKRFDVFIRIIEVVRRSMPGIRVRIAGNGPERTNLQSLVQHAGLEGTITFTGELAHPEMLLLMQRSKIFLHTSSYEGFSGACLEALYAGAHVISFDKPMAGSLPHWHIANDIAQSIDMIHSLLNSPQDHTPVAPYLMDASARSVMGLFGSEFTAER